jgi:uncharacterized protein (TIGR00297 family)
MSFDLTRLPDRWAVGALLTLSFTALARWMRGVTNAGAFAGALCCFILFIGGGPTAFAALITVFALAWITTRIGYHRKQTLGVAEKREGRKASQVVANLGVATVCAAVYAINSARFGGRNLIFLLAMSAALSEAAADTVSSELGQAFGGKAWLITTGKSVPAGTNGGVTLTGTLAGIAAAVIVSTVCFFGGLLPRSWFVISVVAAILGTIADSILGAWLEQRHLLNNDAVNFLSTLVAALVSFWLT